MNLSNLIECNLLPNYPVGIFDELSKKASGPSPCARQITQEHIISLIQSFPLATEGQGGDQLTYNLGCILVRDQGLSVDDALELLLEHWNPRCEPPWGEAALRKKLENAQIYGNGPIGGMENAEWEDIIPLNDHQLPEFPVGVFPDSLEKFSRQVSQSAEVPYDLVAMLLLAALSCATRGRFAVKVNKSFSEPCSLYALSVLEPGNRKSFVFSTLFSPIYEYEKKLQESAISKIRTNESRIKSIDSQIAALRKKIGSEPSKDNDIFAQIDHLEASKPEKMALPRLAVGDITAEKLAVIMAENNSVMALLSDEGGFFENIGGRYNKGIPNLDIYLQSYSRSFLRVDRQNAPIPVQMNAPCLTIGATVQPAVLNKLSAKPEFISMGLLSRFIFSVPQSPIGFRHGEEFDVDIELQEKYSGLIGEILSFDPHKEW